jgi:glycosyltransferase involved in cell wall biosynthesis
LIRALVKANFDHQLVIYTQQHSPDLINLPADAEVEWRIVSDMTPGFRLVWEQTSFPGLIRRDKVNLLHSLHYTKPLRLQCASVVTFHDMTFFLYPQLHTRARRLFFPPMMKLSAKQADEIVTVSESTRRDVIRLLGVDPDKVSTTQLGVDASFRVIDDLQAKKVIVTKYDLPEEFILYLGTIEPRKNLPLLMRAYRLLVDSGTRLKLILVGKYGWMYQEVFNLVSELNLEDMVRFTGYIPQDELPLVYNLASLFVYPTIYEGFGIPVLEAMACGVPVISSDIASLPEIVGEAGILVPAGDLGAYFSAMKLVTDDQDLRGKLIDQGKLRASEFSWERTAQLTQQVYQKVLQNC